MPKSGAGAVLNRYRTVIIVFAQYFDVVLSHIEQEGRGKSLALLYAHKHLTSLLGVFIFVIIIIWLIKLH
jgi:hypothetical protein